MKITFSKIIIILFLISFAYLLFFNNSKPAKNNSIEKTKIAVTIFPLKDVAKNIVGDKIDIVQILPSGASPHTYSLTPKQLLELKNVKVLFYIGEGLDDWIVKDLKDQGVQTVKVSKDIDLIMQDDIPNPHYWLNYDNATIIAKNILQGVIQYVPEVGVEEMSDNLSKWLQEINISKQNSLNKLAKINQSKKNIITFHDGWKYFAKGLELNIISEFELFPGKTPTAEYIANLQKIVLENNIRVIYSEPQISSEVLNSFVFDMGLKIKTLDPLGGVEGRESFVKLMEYNVNQIIK